mmetsp:Transcript_158912/g.289736  ORF Transcript_158912/g.289736 Transcript_158912/m.289736 type:complete len:268 (-) Transcript_158912:104-907(-)
MAVTGYPLPDEFGYTPPVVINVGDTVQYLSSSTKKWLDAEVFLISAEGDVTVGGPLGSKPPGWTRTVEATDADERLRLIDEEEELDNGVLHEVKGEEDEEDDDAIARKPSVIEPVSRPVAVKVPIIGKVWLSKDSVVPKRQVGGYYWTHFDCALMKNTEGTFKSDPLTKWGLPISSGMKLGPPTSEVSKLLDEKFPDALALMERVGLPYKPPPGTLFAFSLGKDWMKLVDALNAEWAPRVNRDMEPLGYSCAACRGKLCILILIFQL